MSSHDVRSWTPNPLNLRIVRWPFKLLYAVGAYVVSVTIVWGIFAASPTSAAALIIANVLDFVALLYGARVFRGRNEDIVPPQAWWRMTARRPLSLTFGILAIVGLAKSGYSVRDIGAALMMSPGRVSQIATGSKTS